MPLCGGIFFPDCFRFSLCHSFFSGLTMVCSGINLYLSVPGVMTPLRVSWLACLSSVLEKPRPFFRAWLAPFPVFLPWTLYTRKTFTPCSTSLMLFRKISCTFFLFVLQSFISSALNYGSGVPGGTSGKEPTCQCRRQETWVLSLSREDPLEEGMAVFLPGEPHGQRSLVDYSHGGAKCRTQLKQQPPRLDIFCFC